MIAAGTVGLEHLLAFSAVFAAAHEVVILAYGNARGFFEGIVLRQEVLAEFLAQAGEAGADFRKTFLAGLVQGHAVALKALVELLHRHLLFTGE